MKLPTPFIQLPVAFDADRLAEEIRAIEATHWRGRTDRDDGNQALVLIAAEGDPANDALSGAMRPTPHLERMPYAMQILEAVGATWGRARLMRLQESREVSAHVDLNYYWRERARVHFPVLTNPHVQFQCGDAAINMRAGECWIFDTWRRHRVINGGTGERIHLVADTVGGPGYWRMIDGGRATREAMQAWNPRVVEFRDGVRPALRYESFNAPECMSPWELKEICSLLLGDCIPHPALPAIQRELLRLVRHWQALWAAEGPAASAQASYRSLLTDALAGLVKVGVEQVGLRNEAALLDALRAYVFDVALASTREQRPPQQDVHGDAMPPAPTPLLRPGAVRAPGGIERPVFIVSPPRSGSTLLFEVLAQAPEVFTIGDESHQLIEGIAALHPAAQGFASNRLDAAAAAGGVAEQIRQRFVDALRDRGGERPAPGAPVRMLEKTPKNALRIDFLRAVFPDAVFVYLHRDPREVLASMAEGWASQRFVTYAELPGWPGPPWSFLLTPGWQSLAGSNVFDIVTQQWAKTVECMLEDLASLPAERLCVVEHARLLAQPTAEARRVADWAGWSWDRELGAQLPLSRYTLTPPAQDKWRRHEAEIMPRLHAHSGLIARLQAFCARRAKAA